MAQVTALLVKTLRGKTGAGMMDCKKALTESDGDIDAAVDWLRKKGLAAAAKKAGRTASEGLVALAVGADAGALVEVNSETDFVARNNEFQGLVETLSRLALDADGDLGALRTAAFPGTERSVEAQVTHMIATIGENLALRRTAKVAVPEGVVGSYVHGAVKPGLGKIGVLVGLRSAASDTGALAAFGRQLAMHIAATKPESVSVADLDAEAVARERRVLGDQARASGKPENIIEKMVEGRMRKYHEEVVLLEQVWVIDGESRVRQVVEQKSRELGAAITVTSFVRYGLGEGIEKEESDFASEVAATLGAGMT